MHQYAGPIYLALAASMWGGVYVVSKAVLEVLPAIEVIWFRYILAIVSLVLLGVIRGEKWKIPRNSWILVGLIGLIGYFFSIWTQFVGTHLSSAQMGSVITSATPAFMVLFARLILDEAVTRQKMGSLLLATVGVLLIVGLENSMETSRWGGLILVMAAITWALMSVLIKKIPPGQSLIVVTTYAIVVATIAMTPLALPLIQTDQLALFSQPWVWGGILYMGTVSTAGAFYFWSKGLQLVEAGTGSLYFFFQPLVGTFLGWLLLGEQVGWSFWLGAGLIFWGVLLVIGE